MENCRSISFKAVTALCALLISAGCAQTTGEVCAASSSMKITETAEGLLVTENDKKVLFYQRLATRFSDNVLVSGDSQTNRTLIDLLQSFDIDSRPHYIHPLYGLDGEVLTEDFPLDHPHHHGIFWAWHQILIGDKKIGDGWDIRDFWWDVNDVQILEISPDLAALKIEVFWKSPNWTDAKGRQKPFVKETAIIRIHPASGDIRKIDFEVRLLALEDGVRIGGSDNKKGYSGFSVRIKLPKGTAFTGTNGLVKPQNLAVEAGPWLDFSGDFNEDGRINGLAVLCHKSIPGYPRPWILRKRESMQNAVYPGREPVPLSREDPLVLRYRLIVHRGNAGQINLDQLQRQYNAEQMPD